MTRHTLLYTEMIATNAIIQSTKRVPCPPSLLAHNNEHPIALQLGGSDPDELRVCVEMARQYGYHEVNLNVGCPSDRVQHGRFGACLMAHAALVAKCVEAMRQAARGEMKVTIKCRIGIDNMDSYEFLCKFIETMENAGSDTVTIHARKAWLKGLSPKQNRMIPPLDYSKVYDIKRDFPALPVIINGGIETMQQTLEHLKHVDGVMMGREAYHNPYILTQVDRVVFNDNSRPVPSRHEIVRQTYPYIEKQLAKGTKMSSMTRHLLGLFHGMPGAGPWKRYISENVHKPSVSIDMLEQALKMIPENSTDMIDADCAPQLATTPLTFPSISVSLPTSPLPDLITSEPLETVESNDTSLHTLPMQTPRPVNSSPLAQSEP
jgi:tRNA-dihydrouridine synthase A